MARRWPATRPRPLDVEHTRTGSVELVRRDTNARGLSEGDRRARAFDHVFPLLSTSIPTPQILDAYRRELRADAT